MSEEYTLYTIGPKNTSLRNIQIQLEIDQLTHRPVLFEKNLLDKRMIWLYYKNNAEESILINL